MIGSETTKQGSKLASLDSYELTSSVDSSGSKNHESLVDVDCEISTSKPIDIFNSRMVKTKQMAHKGADFNKDRNAGTQPHQGIPATSLIKENPLVKLRVTWLHIMRMKISLLLKGSLRTKVLYRMQTSSRLYEPDGIERLLVEKP